MFGTRKFLVGSAVAVAVVAAMPMSSAQGAAAPWCKNADLQASYHATDSATSHRFGRIVLRNVSHHACRTGGYGGISTSATATGPRSAPPPPATQA